MTYRNHLLTPSLSSERRGGEDAAVSRPKPSRKKTLEQRLGEAMSFVSDAQLNEEVAGKVKNLVLKWYGDQSRVSCFQFHVSSSGS